MNIKLSILPIYLIIYFLSLISGCTGRHYIKPIDEKICAKCTDFIEDRKTKREEIIQKSDFYELLGTFKSKNDTILIFKFTSGQDPFDAKYHLVLIFEENDLLKKHSIVRIW